MKIIFQNAISLKENNPKNATDKVTFLDHKLNSNWRKMEKLFPHTERCKISGWEKSFFSALTLVTKQEGEKSLHGKHFFGCALC